MLQITVRPRTPEDDDIYESPTNNHVILDVVDQVGGRIGLHFDDWETAQQWAYDLWSLTGTLEELHNPMVVITIGSVPL
jgi:hypothetical protein